MKYWTLKKFLPQNLGGQGWKRTACYLAPTDPVDPWAKVTDVPCPVCNTGTIRWHEAGHVPGARLCDGCGRFFLAKLDRIHSMMLVRDSRFDR